MTAGLPGAGIGGLFFVLSAYFMLVVEIQRTFRGRSSLARWRGVLRSVAIATAMVIAVTAVVWLVHRLAYPPAPHAEGQGSGDSADGWVPFTPVLFALAVLVAVLGAAFVLRLVVGRKQTDLSEPARAEAPAAPSLD
jgi:NADH:ubiquinone oxidoreductase subunit 6 (subunit J)